MNEHHFKTQITWSGNLGEGTETYRGYSRNHDIAIAGKANIAASSDAAFRGDSTRHNPEELLVAALSSCHMLSYLHLCAVNNIVVTAYIDQAEGTMVLMPDGSGHFTAATLHPHVIIEASSDADKALALHGEAHHLCFIANSVNFPVECSAEILKA